ncbi:PTPA-CTERM sorting domain-containing protein [[Leptolyngbya] sp. PCC 7376]|uniref:PTPA-CTERM sorting domain-containing protein n=1 Tax=[Leptolyngbya] sp. PCC 7376 TaxID=111781 RepID=UPI001CECA63A|nr:PTPA-CTERM sorting domain-containing protein [[Leptolyngbya] sp. PCC 7376]
MIFDAGLHIAAIAPHSTRNCYTVAVIAASPAQALVITTQANTPFSTVEGAQTITFDDATLRASGLGNQRGGVDYTHESGVSYTGIGGDIVQGNKGGRYAAPPSQGDYDNTNNPYLTVGSFGNTASDIVSIDLDVESDYFGFYFGSIDTHNNISFFDGDQLIKSISGKAIRDAANGDQGVTGARFVNIFAEEGENFNRIEFQSDGIAFETDNHAYRVANPEAVPTPAAVLPILSGLFAAAKRRKQDDAAE